MNKYWQEDTKELRKDLGLPLKKTLVYYIFNYSTNEYKKYNIINYRTIVHESIRFSPTQNPTLRIQLETGEEINILAAYLVQMQKNDFIKRKASFFQSELAVA